MKASRPLLKMRTGDLSVAGWRTERAIGKRGIVQRTTLRLERRVDGEGLGSEDELHALCAYLLASLARAYDERKRTG